MASHYRYISKESEGAQISYGLTQIGLYETIGGINRRYEVLEDALICFSLPEFLEITQAEQENCLIDTIHSLQERFGQNKQGSTLNGTIAWKNNNDLYALTANVGDSVSILIILDGQKKLKLVKILNDFHLACAPSPKEVERIKTFKDVSLRNGRLDLGYVSLALTRAIGDNDFYPALSHDPDISFNKLPLDKNDIACLVVACDGLMENDATTPEQIAAIVRQFYDHPEVAAKQLITEAIKISTDNVSVAVVTNIDKLPVAAFVFDGHGGKEVSHQLGEHFFQTLFNNVKNLILKR